MQIILLIELIDLSDIQQQGKGVPLVLLFQRSSTRRKLCIPVVFVGSNSTKETMCPFGAAWPVLGRAVSERMSPNYVCNACARHLYTQIVFVSSSYFFDKKTTSMQNQD